MKNPDNSTEREDAISFGQIGPRADEDQLESADTPGEDEETDDEDEDEVEDDEEEEEGGGVQGAQGISNRPGDMDPDQGIDPEPGNNA